MSSKIDEKDILFLTPTIGSIWLFYQQYLIKKQFPQSQKILINGNHRWNFALGQKCVWYDFIWEAIRHKTTHKYFVHIDEDCFITNKQGIIECIERIEYLNASLIGPTDNMYPIRGANPNALNSFFMIGKISDLETIWNNFDINLQFKDLNLRLSNVPTHEIETEPYYNFFWNYLLKSYKIEHISAGYFEKYNSTTLHLNNGEPFCHHMWYTRYWYRKMKFVTLTHRERYMILKKDLDKTHQLNPFKLIKSISILQYLPILAELLFIKNVKRMFRILFTKTIIKQK
ncbi:MAG: hypothetical protein QM786_08835 [Breznakibacter sp.]